MSGLRPDVFCIKLMEKQMAHAKAGEGPSADNLFST